MINLMDGANSHIKIHNMTHTMVKWWTIDLMESGNWILLAEVDIRASSKLVSLRERGLTFLVRILIIKGSLSKDYLMDMGFWYTKMVMFIEESLEKERGMEMGNILRE